MKHIRRLNETVSFLDQWHFLEDVYPENRESVWFVANGKMYVGTYNETQGAIILADGEGIGLNDVVDWKAVGSNKQIASYPHEKDIIAAEIPGFPALVMGIFTDHAVDEETGDEVSGIILDDIYTNLPEVIRWTDVFSWYLLPASPEKRVIIKNITVEVPELSLDKEESDAEEYNDLDGKVDFDDPKEGFEEKPEEKEEAVPEKVEEPEEYTSEIKKSQNIFHEGRPKGSKNKVNGVIATKEEPEDDDDDDYSLIKNDEIDLEAKWEENPSYNVPWLRLFGEFNPKNAPNIRDFAWWYYHELFYSKGDPKFKKYKMEIIDDLDQIFEKPQNYIGTKKRDLLNDDMEVLYKDLVPEAREAVDRIVQKWKDYGPVRNLRKIKRPYKYA